MDKTQKIQKSFFSITTKLRLDIGVPANNSPSLLSFSNNSFQSTDTRLNYAYAGQFPEPTIYKTFAGIKVENMNLVIPSRQTRFANEFKDICIGMILNNSTVDISLNCRFQDITLDNGNGKSYSYHEDNASYLLGVGVHTDNTNLNFVGMGNKNNLNKVGNIYNCISAAFYAVESALNISNTYISWDPNSGLSKLGTSKLLSGIATYGLKSLRLNRTTIENNWAGTNEGYTFYGVSGNASAATKINIQNTNFTSSVLGGLIDLRNYKGSEPLLIKSCDFNLDPNFADQEYKKNAIFLFQCNKPNILSNRFKWVSGDVITLSGCKNTSGTIENNNIVGNDEKFPFGPIRGIYINSSPNMRICSNFLDFTYIGVLFSGNCSGTFLGNTYTYRHTIALQIGESATALSTVIDPQIRKGNQWIEGANFQYDGLNYFSAEENRFRIEKGINFYPLFPVGKNKLKYPSGPEWFINDDIKTPLGCELGVPPSSPFTDGVINDEWYESYNDVEKWEARRSVYRRIYEGNLSTTDSKVAAFFVKQKGSNIEAVEGVHLLLDDAHRVSSASATQLQVLEQQSAQVTSLILAIMEAQSGKEKWDAPAVEQYEKYMNALYSINDQVKSVENDIQTRKKNLLTTANELNNAIQQNTPYLIDEVRLNQIEIATSLENREMTDAELNIVELIAHKCPKDFGTNVYRAYYSLPKCVTIDFEPDCGNEIDPFDEPSIGKVVKNQSIKQVEIYPNPVNDVLICNNLGTVEQIQIVNSQGQIVKYLSLDKGTQSLEIDVKALPQGIYGLFMLHTDQSTKIQKIVVQH